MLVIGGSICALATPYRADGAIDLAAFGRLLDHQLAGGTQALVVAGSTGEAHLLERGELDRLLEFALKHVAGRVPVIAGTGDAATAKALAATRRAAELGADAALVAAPCYVRPTQEGLRQHFLHIAEHAGLPIIVYNVPSRTGCDVLPATVAALRGHPGIIGIKDAVGTPERIRALAELARGDFVYLSGDDCSAGAAMLAGAAGTVSVVANLVPRAFRAWCDAALGGDALAAKECGAALSPLLEALACAPNPIPVKAGLSMLGLGSAALRLPLLQLQAGPAWDHLQDTLSALASRPAVTVS